MVTPQQDVLFILGDWNAKVGSQKITGVMGRFGLGVQNEAGQRLSEFCQENALVIANILFQQLSPWKLSLNPLYLFIYPHYSVIMFYAKS